MEKVRFGICGAGKRGSGLTTQILCMLETVEILAVCDLFPEKAEALAERVEEKTGRRPATYPDHRTLMENECVDALLIATGIDSHVSIAIDALERGVAVGMEVGGASGEEECLRLLETCERTGTPFMFLENCCYGKHELLAASLHKRGVFGEVVYCHGAYMHDCRELLCAGDGNGYNFRMEQWMTENSDYYPTHDLGPIAKLLNICRGNRLVSLTSRASSARGLADYIDREEKFRDLRGRSFAHGDIVETLISCENGELISLRHDTTLPTYYSREFTVRGTRGQYRQDGNIVMVDGDQYKYYQDAVDSGARYMEEVLPAAWKTIPPEAKNTGHAGIDYLMLRSFVDALRTGEEMPVDVYDAVTWMSIGYLSRESIARGGASVEIPDFTRGAYKTRAPLQVVEL